MAEFKLGRIKFVWKGEWADTTSYYVDDVVNFGGKAFICVIGHTSDADFYTDLNNVPSKWNLMSDGTRWRGSWATNTDYVVNDLVRYGANLYICRTQHTSAATQELGLEAHLTSSWTLFSEGLEWQGAWTTSTRYKVNDLVRYGGYTYVCNTAHTSTASASGGLESDLYWTVFNPGIEYKGSWSGSSVRYKLNDVVKQGAGLWVCTNPHTSSASFISDESNWSRFVEAIQFEGAWDIATVYQPGDVVRYGGNQYISKTNNVGNNPVVSSANWDLYAEGFNFSDTWSVSTSYKIGDVVTVNGNVYVAVADSPSTAYTVTASTSTSPYTFTTSSTTGMVADMALVFSGTTFGDVLSAATYYVKAIPTAGTFTITHQKGGAVFHPTTATGSMTAQVAAMPPNSTYWKQLVSGIHWKGTWVDDTQYVEGDAVNYGSNSYICVLAHRSEGDDGSTIRSQGGGAANSRPDLDFSGTYWNVLTVGSETTVLTTKGDIAYFGASGPTRLPVGKQGQVLRAGEEYPEWVTLGEVDHAYFVAPHGTDSPAPVFGRTWDMPWKTVRYAAQQIEKGPRNPDAQKLLELNRVFIQREVTKWIEYQINYYTNTFPTVGSKWYNFDYDEHKCERDVGFLVDRLIWDIGHGGNLKMRAAAQTYLNALGEGPYSTEEFGTGAYTKISTEGDNDVEAFNYMLDVIESVLNNEAPAANYQILTGDSSTAVVTQYTNTDLVAEAGVMATITSLVGIVTDALTAGVTTNLPARDVPSDQINVAPGTFAETLPIIVPAECAVVGSEVRATHVKPADSLIDLSDAQYTVKSLDRLATVVSAIVTGSDVTLTNGNSESQSQEWPYANSTEATALVKKINAMKYNVDFRLGTIHSYNYPDPTDHNTYYLTGYGDARTLILANKEFFKAQVEAYLDANYPTIYYSRTSCKRDVGYITDALVYDLTYGGNAMTVQAGLAYYQGVGSSLFIDSTEKAATLAAYAYLNTMFQNAATNTTITSLQTSQTQFKNVALTGGTSATTFISNCITEMIDIVNNGVSAATLTDPSTSWVASALTTDYSTMNSAVSTIQTAVIDYINSNFGSFTYNSAACRRDAGYLVDAAYYDAAFGSNFWAVQNGISYKRRQASFVTAAQLEQETGAILYIKSQAATSLASNSTAVTRSNAAYTEIIDILENGVGSADALVYTDTGTANYTNARAQLVTNRAFIISTMVTWMTANTTAYPALSAADKLICQRDIGYAVDALAYDVNYGGNLATRNFARSLFNQLTDTLMQPAGQQTDSAASYTQLGAICAQIVQETYPGQDTSGTAASGTEGTRMTTLAGNIASVVTAGSLSGLVAESAPSISWVAAGIQTAVGTLASNKSSIVAGTLQYITDTFSDFSYNHSKCSRDVATIIKAIGYDMMFNADFQTLKSGYAYLRATATEVFDLNQKTVTRESLTYVRDALLDLSLSATAESRITTLFDKLDSVIYSGSNEGNVCQSEDRMVDYAVLQLERNRDFIVQELDAWMNYNYVNFDDYYNSATCARDIGYIIDAVVSDLATGSNVASSIAGESYYRTQASLVPGSQMTQTVAAVREAKRLVGTYVTHSSQYTAVNAAFENVIAILEGGLTAVPTYTWPDNGTSDATTVADAAALQTNRATMVSSINSWLLAHGTYGSMYSALSTAQKAKCQRDVGYMIDAVSYDLQYGGNMQSTIAGSAYYSFGTLEIASGEKAATVATLTQLATLMKAYTSAGGDTTVDTLTALIAGIINTGATEPMTYTKPSESGEGVNTQATYAAILAGKAAIKTAVTSYITTTFSTYSYNTTLCNRDTNEIIDALKWDLKYSSNYKSLLAVRYYANAVIGNTEEDFFLLRNGTGLRNMTLEGLDGDLTPQNAYGTRRVTAGAYASLDPGWGPDDFRTWIISRSPYMQNCACFGYAAIGQKIDGALHNGGYQSMVSNDFTQLISDGIGAWVTNNGRAELVSVFTYYSHVGYLSENGGRIRGTNGNNSYGDFGSVAEGYDATETPGTAVIDNTAYSAVVGHVFTDGNDKLLKFEYDNAGSDYTEATWTIAGPGTGSSLQVDEFRDDGIFQIFLLDNTDDSTAAPEAAGNYGGYGYVTNSNTAQGGTSSQITIAATDSENSTAYVGMKIYLTGGTGGGQFGIIATYNSGTKVATVTKESTGSAGWDHIVPGTAITSPDASTTYTIEPRVALTSPGYTSTAASLPTTGTWTSVIYGETTAAYTSLTGTYSGTGASGATWQVTRNGWKYFVTNVSGGTGYTRLETVTIDGASLGGVSSTNDIVITITTVNSVTGAIVDFDFAGYGIGGRYVAVRSGSQIGATSEDGINWDTRTTLMPSGANWSAIASGIIDDGSSVIKVGRFMAVAGVGSATTASAWSADGITWTATTMKSSHEWCDIAFGNSNFVAINSDSTTVNISGDGEVWDLVGTLPGTGFTKIVYGKGKFVAIGPGGVGAAYSTNNGYTWTAASLPATTNYSGLTYGNNMFIAVSSTTGTEAAYSLDGITWTAATLPASASWTDVTYGQGLFFAVSGSTQAASSEDGINWTSRTTSTAGSGFSAICFGNRDRYGLFVGVGGSSGTVATYIRTGATAKARAYVAENKIYSIKMLETGSGYNSLPTITITDPSKVFEAPTLARKGKAALGTPSFVSRGTGYISASAEIDTGDGYGDFLQYGTLIAVKRISEVPTAGSNVVFANLPNETYKLVNVYTLRGANEGSQTAYYQVSPEVKRYNYLTTGNDLTTRIRYSQVRLTGHDFLLIGTGNFDDTNYPNTPLQDAIPANETVENNGGRVFYTSTDQDGNFRVGGLFTVEQSTGIATLNADAFNIAGLQELSLGNITLGGGSSTITEFSTDPFFTQDSDNVVPTQRAVKAYISAQIGGGGASLNVNSVTAGSIYISGTSITTTTDVAIAVNARVNFQNAIRGYPVAWNFYMR